MAVKNIEYQFKVLFLCSLGSILAIGDLNTHPTCSTHRLDKKLISIYQLIELIRSF